MTDAASDTRPMAMFPLGTVLLPGMVLPLRIFEPRYRAMLDDLLAGEHGPRPEFGVVLIERGSEVGGGDTRNAIGCVATIVDLQRHSDGTAALTVVGGHELQIDSWMPESSYPMAQVSPHRIDHDIDDVADLDGLRQAVGEIVSMSFELRMTDLVGLPELADDPHHQVLQLAVLLPIGQSDRQRVLEAPSIARRAELVELMATEQQELLRAALGR